MTPPQTTNSTKGPQISLIFSVLATTSDYYFQPQFHTAQEQYNNRSMTLYIRAYHSKEMIQKAFG